MAVLPSPRTCAPCPRAAGERTGADTQRIAARGFTLVEVMVALAIMAMLTLLAWQGLATLLRAREGTDASVHATVRLNTAMAQWQADLAHLQATGLAPTLRFDGSALRLTRALPEGMQVVVWTVQDGHWWRWASLPTTQQDVLQEAWMRSQQWTAIQSEALAMLDDVTDWQVYYFQAGDNGWSNAQSTGNVAVQRLPTQPQPKTQAPVPPAPAGATGGGASPVGGGALDPDDGGSGSDSGDSGSDGDANEDQDDGDISEVLPLGVRLVLAQGDGPVTRDLALSSTQ